LAFSLPGVVFPAAPAILAAQESAIANAGTAGSAARDAQANDPTMIVLALKPAARIAPASARARRKPAAAAPVRRSGEPTVALPSGDMAKLTAGDLTALIAGQREIIKSAPNDETARRNLGLLSVEAANRVLKSESLGRAREALDYIATIKASLADTLWRVTQLVREQPARAQAALGLYYAEGILVPADTTRGCDYFAKAADVGQIDAAFRAWQCTVKTDPKRAQQWLEQAAIGGNPAAEESMGRACIERGNVDAACAKPWLQSAAGQGRLSAMTVLAWLYIREGTPDSLGEALKLYQSAAEAGDFAAQNNLGELLETGRGIGKEPALAFGWYRKSAEGGFAPGQFNLARLLAYGVGTERDTAAARNWATQAQKQGVAQAAELLKLIAENEKSPQTQGPAK
jgi:TPR repeat protein